MVSGIGKVQRQAMWIGHSIEDCVYKAKWGMMEQVALLKERGLPVPPKVRDPKIIVQNEAKLAA